MKNKHLAIYLNDHLAGAEGALELLAHLEEAHAGTPVGDALRQLHDDIEADRQELKRLIERLDIDVSAPRKVSAWLGEKAVQLKLQLDDKASGTLRLFEGLEALLVGIEGKRALWRALAIASEEVHELDGVDYDHLAQRAQEQHDRVEVLRLDAAKAALRATE
jgi:hypothetical protein